MEVVAGLVLAGIVLYLVQRNLKSWLKDGDNWKVSYSVRVSSNYPILHTSGKRQVTLGEDNRYRFKDQLQVTVAGRQSANITFQINLNQPYRTLIRYRRRRTTYQRTIIIFFDKERLQPAQSHPEQ